VRIARNRECPDIGDFGGLAMDGAGDALPKEIAALAKARARLAIEQRKKKPDQDALDDLKDKIDELKPKAKAAMAALPPASASRPRFRL